MRWIGLRRFTPSSTALWLACLAFGALPENASAAIVADFTGGADSSFGGSGAATVDSYRGAAGNGWVGGWTTPGSISSNGSTTRTITAASPLQSGAGNYLSVNHTASSGSTSQSRLYDQRRYGNFESVSLNQPHVLSFLLRVNALSGFNNNFADGFDFFDNNSFTTVNSPTTGTWRISAYANSNPASQVFRVQNGTTNVNSTVRLLAGETYKVEVNLDPAASNYTATITNLTFDGAEGGTAAWTSSTAAFRSTATAAGGFLHFGVGLDGQQASGTTGTGTNISYALDRINIGLAPEPGSLAVLGLLALGAGRRVRH